VVVYTSEYPFVYLTADVVAFSVRPATGLSVLMIRRGSAPHKGRWAFPGGFVDEREDVERAARRELKEETGIGGRRLRLEQLGAYTAPRRDPRHRVVSVAWLAAVPADTTARAGDDASHAEWLGVEELGSKRLAFDHARILSDGIERLRAQLETTALATDLLPPEFTIAELREVYEAVWDRSLDPGNFQRKVTRVPGLLVPTGRRSDGGRGRPAAIYRAGAEREIWPPMSRARDT
jgi:8-oxo-dGTP diphosphatase